MALKPATSALLCACLLALAGTAQGGELLDHATVKFQTTLYTVHYNPSPDHDNHQNLIGIEVDRADNWLYGFGEFDNSFGQPTQYLYTGWRFHLAGHNPEFYAKITAGLLHGYKGAYKNKIPFNGLGVAPVIIPSLGIRIDRFDAEVVILGTAGATFTLGVNF